MLLILNLTINQLLLSILLPTNFSMLLPILNGSDHMSRNLSFDAVLMQNCIIGALNLNEYHLSQLSNFAKTVSVFGSVESSHYF